MLIENAKSIKQLLRNAWAMHVFNWATGLQMDDTE